jgi:hypothetical protein
MPEKPKHASGYRPEHVAMVRSTCLYVATKLGDLMEDVVVVGGLVPTLLVKAEELPKGEAAHVGTMDLDVGSGPRDVAGSFEPVADDPSAREAVMILRRDFLDLDGVGPRRVAEFIHGGPNDEIQADVIGFVKRFLDVCGS